MLLMNKTEKKEFSEIERLRLPNELRIRDTDRGIRVKLMQLFEYYGTDTLTGVLRGLLDEKHQEVFE